MLGSLKADWKVKIKIKNNSIPVAKMYWVQLWHLTLGPP